MHLAQAAKAKRTPKQADFIRAYLQARVQGQHTLYDYQDNLQNTSPNTQSGSGCPYN